MKETIENILKKYVDISCETTFIVGFSGGWDSMCLLDIMNKLSHKYGFLLVAAHLNHNWRGKESEEEKERCLAFCEENNITFIELEKIKGDINADGEFNVADVVLLQKWLLAVPDTHLANWKAADFCQDDKLNVFDLCLMKRELISTRS